MNNSNESWGGIPPVKLAVIFDQLLTVGGGYQQALNSAIAVKKIRKDSCIPVFFTNHVENVKTLGSYGIDATFLDISKFGRLILKIRGTIQSKRILKIIQKIFGHNRFELPLLHDGVDLVYFVSPSSWAVYLEKLNYIITVWDLCHRDYPEFPEVRENRTFEQREYSYLKILTKATAVLADSELGKENLIERYDVSEDRVFVLPFSAAIHINSFVDNDYSQSINIKEKFNINRDYVFYPAQFWAHKNHVYILQGLKLLNEKFGIQINAVFAGGDGGNLEYVKKVANELGISEMVNFLGFVEDEHLPHLYINSIALVMPTYFGPTNIPPIEAFTLNVPVLYSDLPGLREQVKGAALMLDLNNPYSMAQHLNNLINDDEVRQNLIIAGKRKMKNYKGDVELEILNQICINFRSKRYSWGNN